MSRFDLYGGIKCSDCKYYRKSTLCDHWRCDHKNNNAGEFLGMRKYADHPHNINWNQRCKNFKEK